MLITLSSGTVERATTPTAVTRDLRLSIVLNYFQLLPRGDIQDCAHVGGLSASIHRHKILVRDG